LKAYLVYNLLLAIMAVTGARIGQYQTTALDAIVPCVLAAGAWAALRWRRSGFWCSAGS